MTITTTVKKWFARELANSAKSIKNYFTKQRLFDWLFLFTAAYGTGLLIAISLSLSFGLPDFHHGECFNFIFTAAPILGAIYLFCFNKSKRFLKYAFMNWKEGFLSTILVMFCTLFLFTLAKPYFYSPVHYSVRVERPKAVSRIIGVYPAKKVNEKSQSLVGAYSFSAPDGMLENRVVGGIDLGSKGFEWISFAVSSEKLVSGVVVKGARGIPLVISGADDDKIIRTPLHPLDAVQLPIFTTLPEKEDILSTASPYAIAFPGILLWGLLIGVHLRRIAFELARMPQKVMIRLVLFMALFGFFYVIDNFDLTYSPDPTGQFKQGLKGSYYEWHPPTMAFLWIKTTFLFEWLFSYFSCAESFIFLMQSSYWFGFYLIGREAVRKNGFPALVIMFFAAFMPFYYPEMRYMFTFAWKDCLLVGFYLTAIGLALNIPRMKTPFRREVLRVLAILFFIAGTGVRSNAILAAVPLSFIFVLDLVTIRRFRDFIKLSLLAFLVFVITYGAIWTLHWPILKTVPQTPLSYPMMKEYLAIRALSGDTEWPEFLSEKCRTDFERRYDYSKHNSSTDTFLHGTMKIVQLPREHYDELKKFWLRKIKEHPKEYFAQKNDSFKRQMRTYSKAGSIIQSWHIFWISVIICVITGFAFIRLRNLRTSSAIPFLLAASGLMYVISYYILAFVWDFRYLSWFYYAGLLAMAFMIPFGKKRNDIS